MIEPVIRRGVRTAACALISCLSVAVFAAGSSITSGKDKFIKADEQLTTAQKSVILSIQQCKMDSAPEKLYSSFNEFCKAFFGAEREPLVYAKCGEKLIFMEEGKWFHPSANSAAIAVETNLPATSYVEYGEADGRLNKKTARTERPFYLHLHYLKGLTKGQAYKYRVVAIDERGNRIASKTRRFTARMPADAVALSPGKGAITLSKPNTTYVLMGDQTSNDSGIIIKADNVTLDLNGYTVTYGNNASRKNIAGITAYGTQKNKIKYQNTGFKLYNGTVVQGDSELLKKNDRTWYFNPVSVKGADAEIAGVSVVYHGPQIWGITINHPQGKFHIHHNSVKDMGGMIHNRHGAGTRSIGQSNYKRYKFQAHYHHNLIKRTRQGGFSGAIKAHNNEVYVDSFSTNSFAVMPSDESVCSMNRIFGTGFNPYGFGWASRNMLVRDNLVHFQGIDVKKRWHERWGDINKLEAMRVTNYGKGGQVRKNLRYESNLIVLKGGQGCTMRGTGFFSDVSIEGLVFADNVVKVIAQDSVTKQAGCIVTHGSTKKPDSLPVWYLNNTLISNISLINFGDSYAKGHNHYFKNNKLIHVGNNPHFHSFTWGGAYWSWGHKLIDNEYVNMKLDDAYTYRTGGKSHYFVQWTLDLRTRPGADVVIKDRTGKIEYQGEVEKNGRLQVPLSQFRIHAGPYNSAKVTVHELTPHTVTVTTSGTPITKEVEMKGKRSLEM